MSAPIAPHLRADILLLDFDGPICSIFAGYPAPEVADNMRACAENLGAVVPLHLAAEREPLDILSWSATIGRPEVLRAVEDTFCDAELLAARSAEPTEGARNLLVWAHYGEIPAIIVSNNSARAISEYLRLNALAPLVTHIAGRPYGRPDLMKPHPYSILRALDAVGGRAETSVLVGDSTSDIVAAQMAGVRTIGYANKAGKASALADAGADVVVTSMRALPRIDFGPSEARP